MATTKTSSGRSRPKTKAVASKPEKTRKSSPATYTHPDLRDRLKAEIQAGDKGGHSGQWSARKSQLLAAEYKKAGGGYKKQASNKTEAQQSLDQWTDQDWTTKNGKPAIRDGETTRYLPQKAWKELTAAEQKATETKKKQGSHKGKQFVPNTKAAKSARKKASS